MKRSLLNCGMTLVTERLPQFKSAAIGVWVRAGSRHEASPERGLSHFLEHMMFKGTHSKTALEIAREVDRAGGEFNAFTSREYTCFHLLLLGKDLPLGIEVLADVLLNSKLDESEVLREKRVIQQEIDMVNDSPEEVLFDQLFFQAFGGHALGQPILGPRGQVGRYRRSDLARYFKKHYDPSKMVVSVAGDVDHGHIKKLLNIAFKNLSPTGGRERVLPNVTKPRFVPGESYISKDTEQLHIALALPGLKVADPGRFALGVLNTHLGGGMSSRLFQEIRESRGLAYSVYSSQSSFIDIGVTTLYAGTSPKNAGLCLKLMGEEAAKLKKMRLTKVELELIKENLKKTILINEDSIEGHMTNLARAEMFFGRDITLAQAFRAISRVTAKDVQDMAKYVFNVNRTRAIMLGPLNYIKKDRDKAFQGFYTALTNDGKKIH